MRAENRVGMKTSKADLFNMWAGKQILSAGKSSGILMYPSLSHDCAYDEDSDTVDMKANSGEKDATNTVKINITVHVPA